MRLVRSGLTDQHGCTKYADEFAQQSGGPSSDASAIAAYLVQAGALTKYQAKQILTQPEPSLRLGNFVVKDETPVRPLTHWIPVQTAFQSDTQSAAGQSPAESRHGFLLRAPLSALDESRRSWLAAHSEIRHPKLQRIELSGGAQSGDTEQIVEIFSPLPTGASLWSVLKNKPKLSVRKTVRLGVDLADALTAMHNSANGCVPHGAIGADHVWVTGKGNAVLLRDPSSPARSPRSDQSASWIERIESPATYAAPELADPSVMPSAASDIYSLGCLLLTVLTGRPVFGDADTADLFAAHNELTPPELSEAIALGADGDPLFRVLAYAMAKDPAARFDSAATFSAALQRAAEVKASQTDQAQPERASAETPPTAKTSASEIADPEEPRDPAPAEPEIAAPKVTAPEVAAPPAAAPPSEATAEKQPSAPIVSETSEPPETPAAPRVKKKKAASVQSSKTPATPKPEPQQPEANESPTASTPAAPTITPAVQVTETKQPQPTVSAEGSAAEDAAIDSGATTESTAASPALRKRRRRNKNRVPILAGIMILPVLLLGLAVALRGRGPVEKPRPRPTPNLTRNLPKVGNARNETPATDQPTTVRGFEIVESDRLLWVPPFEADSNSPSLELLPPGPAIIAKLEIAELSKANQPIQQAFQVELDSLLNFVSKHAGVAANEIQSCVIGFFPGINGIPETAITVRLVSPTPIDTLLENWKAVETRAGDQVLYTDEDLKNAYYVGGGEGGQPPEGDEVTTFVCGPMKRIREVADNAGGSIPLVRNMQTLWDHASEQTDIVILATPNFLFADGRELINSSVPELRDALKGWLIPDIAAFMIAIKSDEESCYIELREVPSGGATQATLLSDMRETMQSWPDWADKFLLDTIPDRSWRVLASRLPLMLRYVADQTRSTIDGTTVVASTYLPTQAAAQVSLATVLAMNTPPGEASQGAMESVALSVDDMLDRPMSISFLQLSLQFSIDAVADEFKQDLPKGASTPAFKIVGGDLELNGITQNQQIRGFDKEDVPLRQVLTDIVLAANPDPTSTGPGDPKQALVWVVHPVGKPPEETEILITTRDATKKKGYKLPAEFELEQ
ncbi:hypothetical protein LOC67_00680 [Stieleria sp. JC731]|uniref:serine/threonine protein kinase n=1 Tax=Pirellulaceae TaxID=2691357 RepID=UPI001E2CD051|nr:hypothetical protein [Stieleria sp. JC731]MCC9599056.1 hypothetical protein [Stieleria sp. JC731]